MGLQNLRRFVDLRNVMPIVAIALLSCPLHAAQAKTTAFEFAQKQDEASSLLTIRGQGMAPNQIVTLATGPTQKLTAKTDGNGAVSFNNLKYAPTNNLVFSLSYLVKGYGVKPTPNNILIDLDPFTGSVDVKGNATRAASVIVNVSSEDSEAMVANQQGYFSGTADAMNGLSDGVVQVVASIINIEENCCPRSIKPYAPVKITITGQPAKKASANIIETIETASIDVTLPSLSYGAKVSVPASMVNDSWVAGFHNFANSVVVALQTQATSLGTFINAQENINARRSLQQRQAKAAQNFVPSEPLCRFGSLGQSLASSEAIGTFNKISLMKTLEDDEMGVGRTARAEIDNLKNNNCDPADMNGALRKTCKGSKNDTRYNKDVDYTSAVDVPMTLAVNFSDPTGSAQEQDIVKLAKRLFPPDTLEKMPTSRGYINANSRYRSLQAAKAVAKNSFVSLITEKSQGAAGSGPYVKNLVKALGVPEGQAEKLMGDKPSYFAQMEVLTKKLYQDPAFFVNLVDTPANVARQRAAIRAVKLQQQNDFAQTVKRREMLLAVLLELKLRERAKLVNARISTQ